MAGTLYICGTPIGNLEDITLRALRILREADLIAAEDTRHTLKLLNHYEIKTRLTSYHEHNKHVKGRKLIELLLGGKDIALVSDAGMPLISDPGYDLVLLCLENDIPVTTVPGPTAFVSALILSGLSSARYVFEGFLPDNKNKRLKILDRLAKERRTVVLYEAPHNLKRLLKELYNILGDRNIAVIRELTKRYEEVKRGALSDIMSFYEENEPRGEFVLVIEGAAEEEQGLEMTVSEHLKMYEDKGYSAKDAMKLTAKDRGVSKREIYAYVIEEKEKENN